MKDLMSHPRADEALDWVNGLGTPEERAAFERDLAKDADLSALTEGLSDGSAILAMSVPQVSPPASLRAKLMDRIAEPSPDAKNEASAPSLKVMPSPRDGVKDLSNSGSMAPRYRELSAWAAALAFAIGCGWLWQRQDSTERLLVSAGERIENLTGELAKAQQSRDLAKVEVNSLKATIDAYQEGVALVVWDAEKQEGVLKLEKMPPIPLDKDYQLWVVDPSHQNPVDAGVVRVDEQGFARVSFKPSMDIAKAEKFAISVEQHGGVPVNAGPIVLLSP